MTGLVARTFDRLADTRRSLRDRVRERRADYQYRRRAESRATTTDTSETPRHVVLVVVDALRADAVTPEGTPFLAGLDGTDAVSPSTWTFPAVTSLLTGRYPHRHGAMRSADTFDVSVADMTGLPEQTDEVTLPEVLAAAGYETYGAFGFLVPFLALEGRFQTHELYDDAPAEEVLAAHREWLGDRRDVRTFSYLHLADLHEPVDPPRAYWRAHDVSELDGIRGWRHEAVTGSSPTVERYRHNRRRLYRAAAEYVDNRLEVHVRRLRDVADDVSLVIVGDHGEAFWEQAGFHADHFADPRPAHAVGHGGAPFEAVTRVPLRTVGVDSGGPSRRTSLVDVAPTLADATNVDLPGTDGVPLGRAVDDRTVLVEATRYGYEKKAVYGRADGQDWKLLVSRGDDVAVGFSLPEEVRADLPDALDARLRSTLPPWPDGETPVGAPSPRVERRLERLGYQ